MVIYEGMYEHDLGVSLDIPVNPQIGNSYIINATVTNNGLNDEYDVDLLLYLDDVIVESTTISILPVDASETISYMWIPPDFGIYNFTAYAPPVTDETYTVNNFITEIIHIVDSKLFDGMYTNYTFLYMGELTGSSHFLYSYVSGLIFQGDWWIYFDDEGYDYHCFYDVDLTTRIITDVWGDIFFGVGHHDPGWIFTDTKIGDDIPIAILGGEEHIFNVIDDLIYNLPGYGPVEVWVLEDLTYPGGIAWYEKSTGILLNGTFYYYEGVYNYTLGFIDTNVEFTYIVPPSLTTTTPDSTSSWETGTTQSITWTSTGSLSDVKIELYRNDIYILEIVASTPNDGEFSWLIPTILSDSTQYQIKISDVADPATDDFSEDFEIFTSIDSLTVTTPDSLTAWEMGTSQDITWTSIGSIADVKIELYKDGVFEMEIIASTTNDGTYNWDIPTDLEDGIDYQIKISDVSNSATYDESSNFAITSVDIPGVIPSYNLYIVIGIMCVVSVILLKKRFKLIK
jgi:hypothetical protein